METERSSEGTALPLLSCTCIHSNLYFSKPASNNNGVLGLTLSKPVEEQIRTLDKYVWRETFFSLLCNKGRFVYESKEALEPFSIVTAQRPHASAGFPVVIHAMVVQTSDLEFKSKAPSIAYD